MISKEKLEELYIEKEMSAQEIGQLLKINRAVVARWLKKHGIKIRSQKESLNTPRMKKKQSLQGKKTGFQDGHKAFNSKGGRVVNGGYWILYKPDHPRAFGTGYIREHIFIAEKLLGRHLNPGEVIHHLNFDKLDNRPFNLYLCKDSSEHGKLHARKNEFCVPLPNML